jgi:hypothetical protein
MLGGTAQAQRFQFGALGDTGYSRKAEGELDRMMADMNKNDLAFTVHVGDFEADPRPYERNPSAISMPCTDEHYRRVLAQFQTSRHPLVLTPGDNDWTDCHLLKAHKVDPLERLAKVREMFFPNGRSLGGRTMRVRSQASDADHAKFRENLAWTYNGIAFMTMHIVGSNDNKGRTPEMDTEAAERTAANIAWLRKAFAGARARNAPGLVLITQANPGFETQWTPALKDRYFRLFPGVIPPRESPPSGFDAMLKVLAEEMETFDQPALFIHGDTHIFHVSKPLISSKTRRFFDQFTRLEVFGDPDSHWVRITVDPASPALFVIAPRIVAGNRANASSAK